MQRVALILLSVATLLGAPATGAEFRVLPPGERPNDTRLGPLRGEEGEFLFAPAESAAEWASRAEQVRTSLQVAMGLWPMPARGGVQATIHGRREQDDYSIEQVFFEAVPGFFITGNLYRPLNAAGQCPAVLSPHGHFPGGRFQDEGTRTVREKINRGAERFEDGGRSFMQSRCVQLARMGCVVFHYDMVGYADSQQIPLDVAHRFSGLRRKHNQPPSAGLYSPDALLNLHNSLGLHTFNAIRALDFLLSLPDVDRERVAVTGGSGGGTQTFMLCAVDDRPLVSVPVVIVSTTRQGGCTCENVCGLRIGTNNLDFTALHAPKPLLLISADDATRTMAETGFPLLQQHYRALSSPGNLQHAPLVHFPHNYNYVSRTKMYHWLNRHLELGLPEPILERPYQRLTEKELSVWDDAHPRPKPQDKSQTGVWDWFKRDIRRQLSHLTPRTGASLEAYRQTVGTAWEILLRRLPEEPSLAFEERVSHPGRSGGLLRYTTPEQHSAVLPVLKLRPSTPNGKSVIWVSSRGKAGLFQRNTEPRAEVKRLLDAGFTVIGVDLLEQGESQQDSDIPSSNRWLANEEGYGGWTYCYNQTLFSRRVHDLLAVSKWALESGPVNLVSIEPRAPWALAALALDSETFSQSVVDTHGFRFSEIQDIYAADFQPGASKYGGVAGLVPLCSPTKLMIGGISEGDLELGRAAYATQGVIGNLSASEGSLPTAEAIEWLSR